jgi:AraC-like DNA-binding protein
MNYKEIKVDGFLSNLVKCFWMSENAEIEVEHTILPDGYFDLIVEVTDEKIREIKLTGLWSKPMNVKIERNVTFLSIRFKPLASEYLFDLDFKSLLNGTIILPFHFWDLNTLKSINFDCFIVHATNFIHKKIENEEDIDDRKIQLFDVIYQKEIFLVKDISENIFWNSRQINRYFNKQYGISLKSYLNITRCKTAYKSIAKNIEQPQSDYFDQAHFIKEIKKYTGVSPKELAKNKNDRFIQLSTLKLT